jgi:Xaa-Pro aminopeptidase
VSRDAQCDPALHRSRRQRLLNALGEGVLLLPTATAAARNGDVQHEYRPGSDFHYLTGFPEPESVLVAWRINQRSHHSILFVRERDREREIWDGPRYGTRGVKTAFGVDEGRAIGDLSKNLIELVPLHGRLFHTLSADAALDQKLMAAFARARLRHRRTLLPAHPIICDPGPALAHERLTKDRAELVSLRKAAALTANGHMEAMRVTRPGMFEYEAQAALEATFRSGGSPRNGYQSIVASGPNACVLHYHENSRRMRSGDLLLIDAGAEVLGCTADVTRTFPVSGKFTEAQAAVYRVVLSAQAAGIRACKAGARWDSAHRACLRSLTKGLVDLGVLRGNVTRLVKQAAFKPWYMHGTSHWLGRDVHDVGGYQSMEGVVATLPVASVLTVEPGLYFGKRDKSVPEALRGIGIRIEDDVLVTKHGPEVLTQAAPKSIAAIERLMKR